MAEEPKFQIVDNDMRLLLGQDRAGNWIGPAGPAIGMLSRTPLIDPSQIFVPVSAAGNLVFDNGGDTICQVLTPELAQRIALLLNRDAGL